jgi:hypothetical protein
MNWSFKMFTTIASKLPPNESKRGCNMVYQIVHLVKTYKILQTLVVNSDQIGVHLISIMG